MYSKQRFIIFFLILISLLSGDISAQNTHLLTAHKNPKIQERLAVERKKMRASIKKEFVATLKKVVSKAHRSSEKKRSKKKKKQTRRQTSSPHEINVYKKGLLKWPIDHKKFWVSSYYGPRVLKGRKGFHQGIDMAARRGTKVTAAGQGRVVKAGYYPGYGKCIVLKHFNGLKTRYAHLNSIKVHVGQQVAAKKLIGTVGTTGHVAKSKSGISASHLHFEVYNNGRRVNPVPFLA